VENSAEQELLELFRALEPAAQSALLERARRLARPRKPASAVDGEGVAAAVRRLVRSYPQLNRLRMLDISARLLEAHVLHGRPAEEVIRELEEAFRRQAL
jgi:hypothetical protein